MNIWTKKPVTKQQIDPLCNQYGLSQLTASIMVRRNITTGNDILYFIEDDLRFQHSPFEFNTMEDAVERILQTKDDGEKVLIFGDKDADGVTSTAILYSYLKKLGIDVQTRLPVGDDAYGLSKKAVDDFYAQEGSLIITVDCGISNNDEIDYANDLGIDVIITDHHNAPELMPAASIIIDPKIPDCGYPFKDISGAAVAYKLVSALRFAQSDFYNAEICFLELNEDKQNNCYNVDCVKIKNLVKIKELHEKITSNTSIYDLKLPYFLQGQMIYVWDKNKTLGELRNIFGSGIEFNLFDFQSEVTKLIPALKGKSSKDLQKLSAFTKYYPELSSPLNSIFNLYVTYCKKIIASKFPEDIKDEQKDLQLVALAAIADIMPLKDENRIFIKNGIATMKKQMRYGLAELYARLKINTEILNATALSWNVTPALNAAGRLGQADKTLQLLISENPQERNSLADMIYQLNEERKELVNNAAYKVHDAALKSVNELQNKLCLVIDDEIHPGVTGNFAGKLMQEFNVPSIVVTRSENIYKGSMRSCRGLITTTFLQSFGEFFINFGGHDCAAGFSFEAEKLNQFMSITSNLSNNINLEDENQNINIDAEIPQASFTTDLFNDIEKYFEPFGAENPDLTFLSKNIKVIEANVVGKKDPLHLKLVFDFGKLKIPAMLWGQGEKLGNEIKLGKNYDILYSMSKNYFNGNVTHQLIVKEIRESF